jgi:hypothetical protein
MSSPQNKEYKNKTYGQGVMNRKGKNKCKIKNPYFKTKPAESEGMATGLGVNNGMVWVSSSFDSKPDFNAIFSDIFGRAGV